MDKHNNTVPLVFPLFFTNIYVFSWALPTALLYFNQSCIPYCKTCQKLNTSLMTFVPYIKLHWEPLIYSPSSTSQSGRELFHSWPINVCLGCLIHWLSWLSSHHKWFQTLAIKNWGNYPHIASYGNHACTIICMSPSYL